MTEIANPEDFFVTRDEEGGLQPVEQQIPGVEQKLRVIPMTQGEVNRYGISDGDFSDISEEDLAEIFSEHLADLDRELSEDDVGDNMIGFGKNALLKTILRASGYDMQAAVQQENLEMLGKLDEGKIETLMSLQDKKEKLSG